MDNALSCWNPRRWYAELRHVWRDTRLLVLSAQIAAIYAAVLIPFKVGIPIIPGFVELRPANVIPIVGSLLFGPAAAWGAGIGNVIGDCFGTLGPASLFGFLGNFLYGYVPYLCRHDRMGRGTVGPPPVLAFVSAIFLNNLVMATLLGPPLLLFLYPRVKQWNLYYGDLAFAAAMRGNPDPVLFLRSRRRRRNRRRPRPLPCPFGI